MILLGLFPPPIFSGIVLICIFYENERYSIKNVNYRSTCEEVWIRATVHCRFREYEAENILDPGQL